MNAKLRWTRLGYLDLQEIANYVGVQQQRGQAAFALVDEILKQCDWYADNPAIGQPMPELFPEARWFRVKSFLVFYRPIESGIEILRIVHGSRDFPQLFHKS